MGGGFCKAGGAAYSSEDMTWTTPASLFERLSAMYGPFTIDAAASHGNALCADYYTEEDDALSHDWGGRVFCNPPYGRTLGNWMRHAYGNRNSCEVIVMLIPARTDTTYWHDYVFGKADEVLFIDGRVRFGDGKAGAPFPSAVVVYRPDRKETRYGTLEWR